MMNDIFGGSDNEDDNNDTNHNEMDVDLKILENRQKLLRDRPHSCGVMSFHSGTEDSLFLFIQRNAIKGDPESILKAIDVFCYSRHWMMHCGDRKVKFLDNALILSRKRNRRQNKFLASSSASTLDTTSGSDNNTIGESDKDIEVTVSIGLICVEIGSYCGYSAVKIASSFSKAKENKDFLYCIGIDYFTDLLMFSVIFLIIIIFRLIILAITTIIIVVIITVITAIIIKTISVLLSKHFTNCSNCVI